MTFCCIPARGGSQGIEKKNLQDLGGMSLLARAIELAKELNYPFVVTTDNDEIAGEANKYGAHVVFAHPPLYHGDKSRALHVWRNAWEQAESHYLTTFETSLYLEPTSPMRTVKMCDEVLALLIEGDYQLTCTMEPVPAKYSHLKQFKSLFDRAARPVTAFEGPRQDLPKALIRNGAAYAATRAHIFERDNLLTNWIGVVETGRLANIDTPEDLERARVYWRKKTERGE